MSNNDRIATTDLSTTESYNPVLIDMSRVHTNNITNIFYFDLTINFVSNNPGNILGKIFCYKSLYEQSFKLLEQCLIEVFKAISDLDTLYYHQEIKAWLRVRLINKK